MPPVGVMAKFLLKASLPFRRPAFVMFIRYYGDNEMDEKLNMSIRRFLKKVGITSQNEIEKAWKDNKSVKVKMVLTIEELSLEHTIEGEIGED
jgi:hypothetical protein